MFTKRQTTFFALLALVGVCFSAATYETKYDNFDWKAVIENERLSRNYVDCFLGGKTCTSEGDYLKAIIPEALKTDCAKCSPAQKEAVKVVLTALYRKKPDWLKELRAQYDSDDVYYNKYVQKLE